MRRLRIQCSLLCFAFFAPCYIVVLSTFTVEERSAVEVLRNEVDLSGAMLEGNVIKRSLESYVDLLSVVATVAVVATVVLL